MRCPYLHRERTDDYETYIDGWRDVCTAGEPYEVTQDEFEEYCNTDHFEECLRYPESEETEELTREEMLESDVLEYFEYCPLCFSSDSMTFERKGLKDYMLCSSCDAKWHVYYGLRGFRWAKLVRENVDGEGKDLVGEEREPELWRRMAIKGRRLIEKQESERERREKEKPRVSVVKEKEVVREIVMIPCSHCGALMPQTSTVCPHCGARRKA